MLCFYISVGNFVESSKQLVNFRFPYSSKKPISDLPVAFNFQKWFIILNFRVGTNIYQLCRKSRKAKNWRTCFIPRKYNSASISNNRMVMAHLNYMNISHNIVYHRVSLRYHTGKDVGYEWQAGSWERFMNCSLITNAIQYIFK